jgi:cysteine desulfurase
LNFKKIATFVSLDLTQRTRVTKSRAYLDHNATAPLLPEARAAMIHALDLAGNPSSVHAEGRKARAVIEEARRAVAALVNVKAEQVTFTSGATEAANMALTPDYRMGRGAVRMGRLYVSAVEHPAVLAGGRFAKEDVVVVQVDADGRVAPAFPLAGKVAPEASDGGNEEDAMAREKVPQLHSSNSASSSPPPSERSAPTFPARGKAGASLADALAGHEKSLGLPLVSVQLANNESGVIQPLAEISAIVKAHGGILVVDAVQAPGRIPLDMSEGYADFMILSAHKMGGPKGVGALVSNSTLLMPSPLTRGGGQEKGHRAGTEALSLIAGFGAAALVARERVGGAPKLSEMRDRLEAIIRDLAPDAIIHGANAPRLPNTTFFTLPGMKAETAQIAFDLGGVALSAGSACSSGKLGASHVLEAMRQGQSGGALRVSIGHETSEADIAMFAEGLAQICARRDRRAA